MQAVTVGLGGGAGGGGVITADMDVARAWAPGSRADHLLRWQRERLP